MKTCELAPSKPTSVTERVSVSVAAVDQDGHAETAAAGLDGVWSRLSVHLTYPQGWVGDVPVLVRVYSRASAGDVLVAEMQLGALPARVAGASLITQLQFGGPLGAWRVAFANDGTALAGEATITLTASNESDAPNVAGESASVTPGAYPVRAELAYALGPGGRWLPLNVDAFGNLFTTGRGTGGSTIVAGSHNIPDGDPTPTDALNAASFLLVYDEGNNTWWRARGNSQGFLYSTLAAVDFDAGTGSTDLACTTGGALFTQPGLPIAGPSVQDPSDLYDITLAKRVKASAGKVLGIDASNNSAANLYFCLVNKASGDPANGDAVRFSWLVPASGCVTREFARPRVLATGIGFAWSTTANVVTLPGAAPGSADVQFV